MTATIALIKQMNTLQESPFKKLVIVTGKKQNEYKKYIYSVVSMSSRESFDNSITGAE